MFNFLLRHMHFLVKHDEVIYSQLLKIIIIKIKEAFNSLMKCRRLLNEGEKRV